MAKLLIVDDEKNIRNHLAAFLKSCGYKVATAQCAAEALALLAKEGGFNLVLTDYRMAEMNGLALLEQIRRQSPSMPVILMTAYGTIEGAVAAMKSGARDYVLKPFTLDQIREVIGHALEIQSRRADADFWREAAENQPLLESSNPVMRRLLEVARQTAASEATILLIGESGTGKNVLARQIHRWSPRAAEPFVVVNCATASESLLESELFGHVRGAFAGAFKDQPGRLQAADRVTLFLDEIANLAPALQTRVLRLVEEQCFECVGADQIIKTDVRLFAASSRDLLAEVKAHRFREDLFYRLDVITLQVPPLRKRQEDILPLARHFLAVAAARAGRTGLRFSREAEAALSRYRWPGNVRELRNAVGRAALLAHEEVIEAHCLPDALFREQQQEPMPAAFPPVSLEEIQRQHIERVLMDAPTLEGAAAILGIDISTLWRKRKRYKFD